MNIFEICKTIDKETPKNNRANHPLYKKHKQDIIKFVSELVPENFNISKRITYIIELETDESLKTRYFTNCDCCGEKFHRTKGLNSNICSSCKKEGKHFCEKHNTVYIKSCLQCCVEESHKKYTEENSYNWTECKICGYRAGDLGTHLINLHNLQPKEYKKRFNVDSIKGQAQKDRLKGENNPGYQHGGKFSPFSENFIYADEIDREELVQRAAKTRADNDNDTTTIQYWLKKTNGNVEEAELLLAERQSTFSLKKCIEKYGEEEGTKIWGDRQEKWLNNFTKNNYSKISQKLFFLILQNISKKLHKEIFFAEHNGEKNIKIDNNTIKPDFLFRNKVIEFDGDYWHGEKRGNQQRDEFKNSLYKIGNYELLRIKERDFLKREKEIVEQCTQFLTQ